MKNKLIFAGISAVILLPVVVGAASIWSQNRFVLNNNQIKEGNVYVATQEGFISGKVNGDLVMAGGKMIIDGDVSGDALVGAGSVLVSGKVDGDVRLIAAESLISADVSGDLAVVGAEVNLYGNNKIGGDVLILGARINLDAPIMGRAHVSGGEIFINNRIDGNLEVQGGRLTIGEKAIINGNLRFRGPQAPIIAPGAAIKGKTEFIRDDFGSARFRDFAQGAGVISGLAGLLMSLILAMIFFGYFKESTKMFARVAMARIWPNIGKGVLVAIGLPVVSVILLVTIIGFPFGALGLFALGLGGILACALSGILFGTWVMRFIMKKSEYQPGLSAVIWGTVGLRALTFIPVVGWIIGMIFFSLALGVVANAAYQRFWVGR